ncbi:MAG: hypothetical protein ABEJ78_07510 [Haloferacaceae archaeon]
MPPTAIEALRDALDPRFLGLYLLVLVGVLVASVSVEVWATTVHRFYRGDVAVRFLRNAVPWGVLAAVGLLLATSGGVALVREAAATGAREARDEQS